MKRRKKMLWVTDPWSTLDHPRETTLRLMEEGLRLKIPQYWCDVKTVRMERSRVLLDAARLTKVDPGRATGGFVFAPLRTTGPEEFDQIHYRPDPPVDHAYLHPLQLLWLGAGRKLVNCAESIFALNEKHALMTEAGLMPDGIVSSQQERLMGFLRKKLRAVLKPLHLAQSRGVKLLEYSTAEAAELLRAATADWSQPVILQEYLPEIQHGEKRLWYVDGRVVSIVLKKPLAGDFRVNIDGGSELKPAALTRQEKSVARRTGAFLRKHRIRLCAVDLIGGKVTDFNHTSPGLVVQMEQTNGNNIAETIMKCLDS
ncbi:MAG: hypothetical protein A2583_00950 [Bdellovibrionales bacterium RIFOXYD1_FULL_53_11]|nr:MAG: hypothetical protein A2583_00950 [Bdellovibrionales bacterium RIFOXYD1_FULL_53_11]